MLTAVAFAETVPVDPVVPVVPVVPVALVAFAHTTSLGTWTPAVPQIYIGVSIRQYFATQHKVVKQNA